MALLAGAGKLPCSCAKTCRASSPTVSSTPSGARRIALVQGGICDAETVDLCIKNSFGLRLPVMGPLETADLVGLDMTLAIHEQILPLIDRTPGAAADPASRR